MSRITAVAFVVFALSLGAASTVLAQSQTSADASCPAAKPPTSVYAGTGKPASYSIPDPSDPDSGKTITVINLSKKSCTQSCVNEGGGTVTGLCVSQDVCGAETTCNGQKPQQVTTQQVQSAVNGSQSSSAVTPNGIVSQEFQTLPNSGAQTPASIVSQNFPQSGSSIPQVSVPPSWLQQVGTAPSENGSASYANQSILTQAFNTLEGNSSGNSTESNTSVPTTPEEYLQSTFGTSPSGALSPPAGENISVNSYAQYLQTLPSGNQAYIIPANDPLNETLTQNPQAAIAVTGTDFSVVAKLPDGSIAVLPGNQYGITNNGYVGVNAAGLNDGRLQGMGLSAALTYFGLAPAPQPLDEKIDYMLEGQTFGTDASAIFSSQNPTTGTSVGQDVAQLMDDPANHSLGAYVASFGNLGNPQLAISGTMYSAAGEQTSLTDSTAIPFSNVPQPTPAVTVTEIELPPPTAAPTPPEDTPLETPPATQQVPAPLPDPIYVAKLPEPEPFDVTSPEQSAPAPSISAQESAPAGQSSPPEQSPGQTQEAGPQPPAQSAPEALSQSGQPPAQTSQQPDNSGNDQAGGQQKSPDTTQAVGATGGNQANQGGAGQNSGIGAVTSFLGGLLKGIAAVASAPAAQQPLVYSPTAPLATAPASEYGTLGPCPTTTQTNSQQQQQPPCGATSNVPVPQLVASLPTAQVAQGTGGTSPSAQQTNPNIPQTIVPAKTQTQAGSSPVVTKTSEPPTSASGQSGNDTLVNPQGTQPGPTGTSNPAGTQQGGTGAPAATPGNGSSQPTSNPTATSPTTQQQPTTSTQQNTSGQGSGTGNGIGNGSQPGVQAPGSNATNCQTISCWAQQQLNNVKKALQSPGKALADLFSVGSANAAPSQQFTPQDAAKVFEKGFRTFVATAVDRTQQTSKRTVFDIENGVAAAGYLSNRVEGSLKGQLQSYVKDALALKQAFNTCVPATQSPGEALSMGQKFCLGGAKIAGTETSLQDAAGNLATKGAGLVADVKKYVNSNPTPPPPNPSASIGPIGAPAPSPLSTGGQPTGSGETPAPSVVAKSAPFTGAASVYDCRLGGINGNCNQSATGGLGVNPSEYSAALQVGYAKVFQTGYGQGNVGYALVENLDTGRQMIVKVNDNGPLTPGRVIDFSPATMNCLAYGDCNNDATLHSTVLPNVKVTVLQGNYTPGVVANGVLPTAAPCNYRGCATPTPNPQVAAARTPGLTSAANCSGSSTLCASDPTTGAAFTCQGDQATCLAGLQQQLALSRLCASNPATCTANATSYSEKSNGTATPPPEPRKIITMTNNYGTTGRLAKNPNVPTVSGISSQDLIGKLRAAGVPVQDMSSASLAGYPHGKNQMTALTWHGDGSSGNGAGLVQEEIGQNNAGASAAQAVLQQDGTLVVVAPLDAVSFHAATMNALGPGIEIQGMNNTGANPTPAQTATMQKITNVVMDQLGWEVATHGQIEPGHKDALEAGPATISYVYDGVAPAPVPSYTLVDAQGNPILGSDGNPVTTTQAPGTDGTGQFLVGPDGQPLLDSSGKPIPVPPVQVTQSLSNPNVYTAPDDRPQQPAPANPWAAQAGYPNSQYAPVATAQPVRYASLQPPSQAYPQPIQQPLPYPAPASSTQNPAPMVNIAANPQSVASGKTSTITWNSLGTTQCNVVSSTGTTLSSTSTKGTIVSPQLSATTVFTAQCQAQITTTVGVANTTISASTSVTVQ